MAGLSGRIPPFLVALATIASLAASDDFAQCLVPEEVGQLSVSRNGTDAVIEWNLPASASASELVRGDLRTGRVNVIGVGGTCLGTDLSGQPTAYTEAVNPPAHFGFWYLVRATNECGKGSWGGAQEAGVSVARVTECGCHPDFATTDRYATTYDTVSDRRTCLEWEKKSGDTASMHSYVAVATLTALQLDNPSPSWLTRVNTERFAGHGDWRIPKSSGPLSEPTGQPPEIESLLLVPCPDVEYEDYTPCIDPVFGFFPPDAGAGCPPIFYDCRKPHYWSSSTVVGSPTLAWIVEFIDGTWDRYNTVKNYNRWSFRAVRGTLYGE